MKIVVLAGGNSPERHVSLSSGSLVANALCQNGHDVALVDLFLGVKNISDVVFSKEGNYQFSLDGIEPDIEKLKLQTGLSEDIGPNVISICHMADLVFLALHGGIGENGELQKILEKENIPFTGSSSIGCKLSMDKGETKKILIENNITTANCVEFNSFDNSSEETILSQIGIPCVVKPIDGGSSVGVSIIQDATELKKSLLEAFKTSKKVIVEKFIKGREFSVGVLQGKALPPIEIVAKSGFYDYKKKYVAGYVDEICPCNLTEEQDKKAKEAALQTHNALKLGSYSRTDLILNEIDQEFYVLEANALPGMTPMSLLPQEAACVGIDFNNLCQILAEEAINNK